MSAHCQEFPQSAASAQRAMAPTAGIGSPPL